MHERIVYGQQDLLDAINDGFRAITLCAGIYKIPIAQGMSFDRLGPVEVSVDGTRAEADAAGMEFIGIYPEYKSGYAVDRQVPLYTVAAASSGSYGGSSVSFGGSFAGSFSWYSGMGGSFTYGSLSYGSFASSGFAGSFSSMGGSGITGAASSGSAVQDVILGYGIDLI